MRTLFFVGGSAYRAQDITEDLLPHIPDEPVRRDLYRYRLFAARPTARLSYLRVTHDAPGSSITDVGWSGTLSRPEVVRDWVGGAGPIRLCAEFHVPVAAAGWPTIPTRGNRNYAFINLGRGEGVRNWGGALPCGLVETWDMRAFRDLPPLDEQANEWWRNRITEHFDFAYEQVISDLRLGIPYQQEQDGRQLGRVMQPLPLP